MIRYETDTLKKRSYLSSPWTKKRYAFTLDEDKVIQKKKLPALIESQANQFIDTMCLQETPKAQNQAMLLKLIAMFGEMYATQVSLNSLLFIKGNKVLGKNGKENINGFINESTDKMERSGLIDIYDYCAEDEKSLGSGKFYMITAKGRKIARQLGAEVVDFDEVFPDDVSLTLEKLQTGLFLTQMIKFTSCDDFSTCIDEGSPFVRVGIYNTDVFLTSLRNNEYMIQKAKMELDALDFEAGDSVLTACFCLESEKNARQINHILTQGKKHGKYSNLEIFFTSDNAISDLQRELTVFCYDDDGNLNEFAF